MWQSKIHLFRIWNIPIGLHPSWFVIFILVTWSLSSGYFVHQYPEASELSVWGAGLLTSLLFFGSVLAHELGHAYVALRNRIPVRGISLFLFGGVAEIGREPDSPGVEFRVAIAGPLVSLALGVFFHTLAMLDAQLPYLAAPSRYLGQINLMLVMFNLIPGFPLDGGRLLRAAIWRWNGDLYRSTRIAALGGQLIGFGFMAAGAFMSFSGQMFSGIWVAVIGVFLHSAAGQAAVQAKFHARYGDVTVGQVMNRDVTLVPRRITLDCLVQQGGVAEGRKTFLINEEGELPGMVTLRDVLGVPRQIWYRVTAGEIMRPLNPWASISPEMSVLQALQKMEEADVALAPVMEGREVAGVLSRQQVMDYLRARSQASI